ncbi:GNAT family N-acetyltransferase [Motilibacter deserti]|uniref:GNAT family N-acetyltransferase n=1 Tax=Motilibacter deserti TaxID=2714956 RepID=A0ABX0GWC1_9ACTN|nr:GNAT family N-acetyltransferase [Motilibacter deserti]
MESTTPAPAGLPAPPLAIRSTTDAGDPDVRRLVAAAEDELRRRYPEDDDLGPDVHALVWLVAERDGHGVGIIALCPLEEGVGELKRLYVADEARRGGVARALLDAAEDEGRARGMSALRLETGTRQPEAMALYQRHGWAPIAPYGYWAGHPMTRCYGKQLAGDGSAVSA